MLRRLLGLLMLVAALAPIALGIGVFIVGGNIYESINRSANARITAINERMNMLDLRIAAARESFAQVEAVVDVIAPTISGLSASVSSLTESIDLPTIDLPDITVSLPIIGNANVALPTIDLPSVTIPGLGSLDTVLTSAIDILEDIVTALGAIADLRLVADDMQLVFNEASGFYDELAVIINQNAALISLLCAGGAIWLLIFYIAFLGDWLMRGWNYLTGRE